MGAQKPHKIHQVVSNDKKKTVSGVENYNQSSCQAPTVKMINCDNVDPGMAFACQCGHSINASTGTQKASAKSAVHIVTYKKMLGPDKMLIIKQEIEKPCVTLWIIFHALMFLCLLVSAMIVIQIASLNFTKAEEIMAVLTLLLFILVYFRPRYFILSLIFDVCRDKEEPITWDVDECQN